MPQPARATVWMLVPLTDDSEGRDAISYGLWITVGGRWFVCPEIYTTREAAETAVEAVREGLK